MMKLLHESHKATDPLYNRIQKDFLNFDPPSLLRDRVEGLYAICHNLVDKKFFSQIQHNFAACYSELYFCATFKERLGFAVKHPSDKGPDFYLEDLDCWLEIVTLSSGEKNNPNSIPQIREGDGTSHPEEQIILRITSSFTDKAEKIFSYIKEGLIKKSQRVVICISGGWIEPIHRYPIYPVGGFPEVVKALLPIGDMLLVINKNDLTSVKHSFKYKDYVNKIGKQDKNIMIKTDYFLDRNYSCISAVIYSYANVMDSTETLNLGKDFFLIHNPLADNPLLEGSIACGIEYKTEIDDAFLNITRVKHL